MSNKRNKAEVWTIINATPDSFFEGSRANSDKEIIEAATKAIEEGASRLDIGGLSTRPGHTIIDEQEELKRLENAIGIIKSEFPDFPLSVDTFRASVVERLYDSFGEFVVNDIEGGINDPEMLDTVARLGLKYVMMSNDATIESMEQFFECQIGVAVAKGVKDIVIDPGFGFGKTVEQNFSVLCGLETLKRFGLPIFVGVSRKSMIWRTLNITPNDALNGTTTLNFACLERGATILRVHDTKEAVEAIKLYNALLTHN